MTIPVVPHQHLARTPDTGAYSDINPVDTGNTPRSTLNDHRVSNPHVIACSRIDCGQYQKLMQTYACQVAAKSYSSP